VKVIDKKRQAERLLLDQVDQKIEELDPAEVSQSILRKFAGGSAGSSASIPDP